MEQASKGIAMRYIGIDPGLSGAIAVVTASGQYVGVHDMPTREVVSKDKVTRRVDARALATILRTINLEYDCVACVENINAMPSIPGKEGKRRSMGATSALNFGRSAGIIEGVLGGLGIGCEFVTAASWKRNFKLPPDKYAALELARQLFPAAPLTLKKHDGRAEALLIARWMALQARDEERRARIVFEPADMTKRSVIA